MINEDKREKARWQRIFRVYGITKEQFAELDLGHCPVCLRDWDEKVRPCVDHDHKTGEIRGILCIYCNRYRVGNFRDPEIVQRICDYLKGPFKGWKVPPKKKKRKRNAKRSSNKAKRATKVSKR